MSDGTERTGAARDVPPPRPVRSTASASATPVDEAGLGRAARAVAEAVAGLVGAAAGRSDATSTGGGTTSTGGGAASTAGGAARSAVTGLREVVGAVAGAVGAALGAGREDGRGAPANRSATPGALRDVLAAAAPKLPIRDAARLRQAYP